MNRNLGKRTAKEIYSVNENRLLWLIAILLAILAGFANLVFAFVVRQIGDYVSGDLISSLESILIVCALLLLATILINWLKQISCARLIRDANLRLKDQIFRSAFSKSSANTDYVSVLTHDIQTINSEFYQPILDLVMSVSMFLFAASALFLYNWFHGTVMVVTALLSVLVSLLQKKHLAKKRIQISSNQEAYTARVRDLFFGLTIIRQFQALQRVAGEHQKNNSTVENSKFAYASRIAGLDAVATVISMFMFVFSFALGGLYVRQGIYSLGMMMAAIQLVNNIVIPMRGTVQSLNLIHGSRAVYNKIKNLLITSALPENSHSMQLSEPIRSIELRDLSFQYDDDPVLNHLTYHFQQGKKYALVGESGCGKTTLLNLMSRQLDCEPLSIVINGIDIKDIPVSQVLSAVAFMNQNVCVLNDTIANNIALFADVPDELLFEATRLAGLQNYIDSVPGRFQFIIENNGSNLSGGQKQRLALARVLMRKAGVVLLDEAFSSLDPITIDEIINNLLGMDCLLIAAVHQINPHLLGQFDEVLVIHQGRLVESGSFADLIKNRGHFYDLYRFD